MLVKGIIEEVINIHQARVRIPRVHKVAEDPSGTRFDDLPIAVINTPPGVSPFYAVGDVVIIGFENDDTSAPIVLGLLYKKETNGSTSGITTPNLKVETNVNLPNTIHVGEDPNNVFSLTNEYGQTTENRLGNIENKINNIDFSPYAKKAFSFSAPLVVNAWNPVISDSWLVFGDSSNFGYLVYDISQDLSIGTGNFDFQVSFNAASFPNSGYTFAFAGSAGEMFIGWYGSGSTVTGFGLGRVGQAWDTQITGLSLTGWHTYRVLKNNGQVTLYIDNSSVLSSANTQSYNISATNGKIYVGNDYSSNYPIKGNLKSLALKVNSSNAFILAGTSTTSIGTYGSAPFSTNIVTVYDNISNYTQEVAIKCLETNSNVILSPNPSIWNIAKEYNVYGKAQSGDFSEEINIGSLGSTSSWISVPDRAIYTSLYVNTGSALNKTTITIYDSNNNQLASKLLTYHSTIYLGEVLGLLTIYDDWSYIDTTTAEKLNGQTLKVKLEYGSSSVTRYFKFWYPMGKLTFSADTIPPIRLSFNGLIVY